MRAQRFNLLLNLLPLVIVLAGLSVIVDRNPQLLRSVLGGDSERVYEQTENYQRTKNYILARYYQGDLDDDILYYASLKGMVEALDDPYSAYFDPEDLADFNKDTQGKFAGLGITIVEGADGHITVVSPLPNSPALEAGMLPGDKILAVDGENLRNLTVGDAVERLTGDEGEAVTLTVRHAGAGLELSQWTIVIDLNDNGFDDLLNITVMDGQPIVTIALDARAAAGGAPTQVFALPFEPGSLPEGEGGPGTVAADLPRAIGVADADGDGDLDVLATLGTRERTIAILQDESRQFAIAPADFDLAPVMGVTEDLTITRAIVKVPSITATRIVDEENGLGYIRVASFGERTDEDFRAAILELSGGDLNGLIVDLRFNRGGLLDTVIDMVDCFLDAGQLITYTQGRHPDYSEQMPATQSGSMGALSDVAVVVLVNRSSASASEIFAGGLQDHQRALIVGETSYGKGLVQNVFTMENNQSALKITTARYYTPNGRSIQRDDDAGHRGGIIPDYELVMGDTETTNLLLLHRDEELTGGALDNGDAGGTFRHAPDDFVDHHLDIALRLLRGETVTLPSSGNNHTAHPD